MKALFLLLVLPLKALGFSGPIDSLNYELSRAHNLDKKIRLNAELSPLYYQRNLFDSALYHNTIACNLAASKTKVYPYDNASLFVSRVKYLFRNQQLEEATNEALKLFRDTADVTIFSEFDKFRLCEYYSVILRLKNKPREALIPLQRALKIGERNGRELGNIYYNMGAIFYEISNYKKAREYFDLAKKYDDIDSFIVNSSMVSAYIEEEKSDEALKLLKTMISEKDPVTLENYKLFIHLGQLYLGEENYDSAVSIFLAAYEFMENNNVDIYDLVDINLLLSSAYIFKFEATKNTSFLTDAKYHIETGLVGVKQTNRLMSKVDFYFNLTRVLMYQGQNEAAMESFIKFREAQMSLYDLETSAKVEELDVKYQVLEKQKRIALLRAEKVEAEVQHRKDNNTLILLISVVITASITLLFLYLNTQSNKKRIEQELQIESLKKQDLKAKLHLKGHELKNNIMLISEKNMLIQNLKEQSSKSNYNIDKIIEKFEQNYITDKEWDDIRLQFDSINNGIIEKTQKESGKLTSNDIKLFILLKLNYSNNTMAEILNISYEGVKKAKQRLNKKINLEEVCA